MEDPFSKLINTDLDTNMALAELQYKVLSGEDIIPGSEIEKMHLRYKEKKIDRFHLSLSPEFRGTAEDIARQMNKVDEHLADPINNLLSRIGGHLFIKKDYVACTEKRFICSQEEPYFLPVTPSKEEQRKIQEYKKDIELFEEAMQIIKDLRNGHYS